MYLKFNRQKEQNSLLYEYSFLTWEAQPTFFTKTDFKSWAEFGLHSVWWTEEHVVSAVLVIKVDFSYDTT